MWTGLILLFFLVLFLGASLQVMYDSVHRLAIPFLCSQFPENSIRCKLTGIFCMKESYCAVSKGVVSTSRGLDALTHGQVVEMYSDLHGVGQNLNIQAQTLELKDQATDDIRNVSTKLFASTADLKRKSKIGSALVRSALHEQLHVAQSILGLETKLRAYVASISDGSESSSTTDVLATSWRAATDASEETSEALRSLVESLNELSKWLTFYKKDTRKAMLLSMNLTDLVKTRRLHLKMGTKDPRVWSEGVAWGSGLCVGAGLFSGALTSLVPGVGIVAAYGTGTGVAAICEGFVWYPLIDKMYAIEHDISILEIMSISISHFEEKINAYKTGLQKLSEDVSSAKGSWRSIRTKQNAHDWETMPFGTRMLDLFIAHCAEMSEKAMQCVSSSTVSIDKVAHGEEEEEE
jgi:hypothetical protein